MLAVGRLGNIYLSNNAEVRNGVKNLLYEFLSSCKYTTITVDEFLSSFATLIFATKLFSSSFIGCATTHLEFKKIYSSAIYLLEGSMEEQASVTNAILKELATLASEQKIFIYCRIYHDFCLVTNVLQSLPKFIANNILICIQVQRES